MLRHAALWSAYQAERTVEARNRLVEAHLGLVRKIASRITLARGRLMSRADLESAGAIGLIGAIERFDMSRGYPFLPYAAVKIRGAMLDERQAWDPLKKHQRWRWEDRARLARKLREDIGWTPTDEEMAYAMGLSLKTYRGNASLVNGAMHESAIVGRHGRDEWDNAEDPSHEARIESLGREDFVALLLARHLSDAERRVIGLRYWKGMTLLEIARVMELTESRISQIHRGIVDKLRPKCSAIAR